MNAAGSAPNMIIDETMAIYKMRLAVRGIPRNMSVILFALPVLSSAKNKMPAPASAIRDLVADGGIAVRSVNENMRVMKPTASVMLALRKIIKPKTTHEKVASHIKKAGTRIFCSFRKNGNKPALYKPHVTKVQLAPCHNPDSKKTIAVLRVLCSLPPRGM